ncbi:Ribokinase-like protein [Lipomyces kononenkoae]|uniref:Ribokinase-like protein n=1 Tax=Lipomyces kononenkoae TaxID=34357 RepID=A0ACC3SSM2_LIPKO
MVPTSRELLGEIKKFVPPLLEKFHKGQAGRIAVVGGSEDYTGAPYFAALAATLLGADMAHIICERHAAQVIKTYSPNMMVHPYMRDSNSIVPASTTTKSIDKLLNDEVLAPIYSMLSRLHVIVVGPGLGRDKLMLEIATKVIERAKELGLHIVIDADGLFLVQQTPDVIRGYTKAVLTPNIVEFQRLCKALGVEVPEGFPEDPETAKKTCHELAKAFGGPVVLAKGRVDYISDGKFEFVCDMPGGKKRVGGQGDTLSGTLSTFLAWKHAYQSRIWDHDVSLDESSLMMLSAYGAAAITRYCSRAAFGKYGRAMLASNLSEMIGDAYNALLEDDKFRI